MSKGAIDGFKLARGGDNRLTLKVSDERIPMLLSYAAVRYAAKDGKTYSSDAPFREPIPSEETERKISKMPLMPTNKL